MEKMLKTVLLKVQDVEFSTVEVVEVEDELHAFYKMLDCEMIELPQRKIGDKYYLVMCDEEGLLRCNPICSAVDDEEEPMLYGNLMFFNDNGEGGLESLSDDDIKNITSHIVNYGDYKLLTCNY